MKKTVTTPQEAYDDSIWQAREAARRQRVREADERDIILRSMHGTAALTLERFADMLEQMRDLRCPRS